MPSRPIDYRNTPKAEPEQPKQDPPVIPATQRVQPFVQKPSTDSTKPKIDPLILKRTQGKRPDPPPNPPSVSAGPVDRVIELAFNPTREKIPEVTIIDRLQGRLLPQLTLIARQWQLTIEIAAYRQDSNKYFNVYNREKPLNYNPIEEYMYSLAQWQKSIGGKNLERATDIALAETERQGDDDGGDGGGSDAWKE